MSNQDTAESLLAKTLFIVEATHLEQHLLWADWSTESDDQSQYRPTKRLDWKKGGGWVVQVGSLDNMLVRVSMMWATINGHLVMFWEPTSLVVDYRQINTWLEKHFTGTWDNGTRRATTDASNFHHCAQAIDAARKVCVGDEGGEVD